MSKIVATVLTKAATLHEPGRVESMIFHSFDEMTGYKVNHPHTVILWWWYDLNGVNESWLNQWRKRDN